MHNYIRWQSSRSVMFSSHSLFAERPICTWRAMDSRITANITPLPERYGFDPVSGPSDMKALRPVAKAFANWTNASIAANGGPPSPATTPGLADVSQI